MKHTKVIRGHDYTVLVLDCDDGGTRHDGCLCRLPRAAVLEEGVVIGAVDIISRLCLSQDNMLVPCRPCWVEVCMYKCCCDSR